MYVIDACCQMLSNLKNKIGIFEMLSNSYSFILWCWQNWYLMSSYFIMMILLKNWRTKFDTWWKLGFEVSWWSKTLTRCHQQYDFFIVWSVNALCDVMPSNFWLGKIYRLCGISSPWSLRRLGLVCDPAAARLLLLQRRVSYESTFTS